MAMTMKKGRSIPGSRLSLFLLLLMAAFASTSSATDGDESVIVAGTAIAVKKLRTRGPTGCQDAEEREAVRDVLTRVLDELDQLKSRVRSLEEGNGRLYRDPSPRDPPPQPERRTLQAAPRTVSLTQFNQFKRSVTAQLTTLNQSLAALSDALTGAAARLDTTAQGLSSLEARLACVDASSDGNELVFSGCNVNIRNGLNRTESTNGRGNLVVGYNENESDVGVLRSRDGSHMVVVGPNHGWRGFGGIVSGESHLQESGYASIVGGQRNVATGVGAVVIGGTANVVAGDGAVAAAGQFNLVAGIEAMSASGRSNRVLGNLGLAAGGKANTVASFGTDPTRRQDSDSVVLGGAFNEVKSSGSTITMVGGFRNAIPFGSSNSASNLVQVGGADHTGTGLVTHDVSVSGTRFPG